VQKNSIFEENYDFSNPTIGSESELRLQGGAMSPGWNAVKSELSRR